MIRNQWYAIAPSKIVKKGKLTTVKRLGLELVLFRDTSNTLGCVIDQCTHRGAALSKGKVIENHLQCPFHGLEFDSSGKCAFIPANGKASNLDISRYNVKSYCVKEKHEIIYLWYGDGQPVGDIPFFDDELDDRFRYSEIVDHWNTHYSRCIENQLDVIHLPFVHYNPIGSGNKTIVHGPKVIIQGTTIQTSSNNEVDIGQTPRKGEECSITSTYLLFTFPNLWMNHISEEIKIVIYFVPVDDENTLLYIRFYCKISPFKFINSLIAFTGKAANRRIERQDKRIVITQTPKASSYKSNEKLLHGDSPIIAYRRIREELKAKAYEKV